MAAIWFKIGVLRSNTYSRGVILLWELQIDASINYWSTNKSFLPIKRLLVLTSHDLSLSLVRFCTGLHIFSLNIYLLLFIFLRQPIHDAGISV